jgi:hypothetical protein
MKKNLWLLFIATSLFAHQTLFSQQSSLFMPREIKQAYENGTRSYEGKPGAKYWQNLVDYRIEVEVDPASKKLSGSEVITFHNQSPNDLNQVVIRLYHDVFREANPRAMRVATEDVTEGVIISKMLIDGKEFDLEDRRSARRQGTNMTVNLPEPLKAAEKLEMEIDWEQYVPITTRRTGAYDSTSFFLAYWYPQVAVYDDVFGWDRLSYDFSTEFYNNLGNYDVKITTPTDFTVLSTGQLQNADQVLSQPILDRYQKAKQSEETVMIVGTDDLEAGLQHQSGTWHYKASEVSDFAFCLSDHFCWDGAKQQVEDRDVFVQAFYQAAIAERAQNVTANQRKMMQHFSEDMPGIPYPYPEFTTFISGERGGGMEYPMMANNGGPGLGVTVHEMFHTYFPMYVRTNEKRFAWMDEGWADFTTSFVINNYFQENDDPVYAGFGNVGTMQGTISDLPLITSTQFMDNTNYGYTAYPLPSFLYSVLYHHLGDEMFKKCLRTYITRWAKKSPTPYDFFYTFEDVSGQDLSWFWKPWFFDFGSVDVAVDTYKKGKLSVVNRGTRPVPISIKVQYQDGSTDYTSFSAGEWGEEGRFTTKLDRAKEIESLAVNRDLPDENILDNFHPPLQDLYAAAKVPEGMLGVYQINEAPIALEISMKEGILYMQAAQGANFASYLLPQGESYETLDSGMRISFEEEDGKYTGITLQVSGFRQATGRKL